MANPRYTGDTLKKELAKRTMASPSGIKIIDLTEIENTLYIAIVNKLWKSNQLVIYKETEESYEKVLSEQRDANTLFFTEDDYKHALKLFEEVKKRKKCE